jgi:hypothetical protein
MEAKAKKTQKMEEQRLKRFQKKKERDKQQKREETEWKWTKDVANAAEKALEATTISPEGAPTHRPDPTVTTSILLLLNQGLTLEEMSNSTTAPQSQADAKLRSPVKKKQFTGDGESSATAKSIKPTRIKLADFIDLYKHKHPHVIIEAGISLTQDNPFQEFIGNLQQHLKNGQLEDPKFAFCPVNMDSKDKKIFDHTGIPINMTMLGAHVKILNFGRNPFMKQKTRGKGTSKGKEETKDPMVYFTMVIATDSDLHDVISHISHKWNRLGGTRLMIKDLQTVDSELIVALFNVLTMNNKDTVKSELHKILVDAQERVQETDSLDFIWPVSMLQGDDPLPQFELRLHVPKLPVQDVSHFNKLPWIAQQNRKVYHVEGNKWASTDMRGLIQYAKEFKMVRKMCGQHVHVSETVDKASSQNDIKRLMKVAMRHTSYQCQCSMVLKTNTGTINLDGAAAMYKEDKEDKILGVYTLRHALLEYFKMADGHHLIPEIHQEVGVPMAPVVAAIPATLKAETMVSMMNKQFPAYTYYTLKDNGLKDNFLIPLLQSSCDNTLTGQIQDCTWDAEKGILSTTEEHSQEKNQMDLESASWFQNAFATLEFVDNGPRRQASPPEQLFNLNSSSSIGTIHERHTKKANSNPSLSKEGKSRLNWVGAIDIDSNNSDEDSASSSSDVRSRSTATTGVNGIPPSSSEEAGSAEDATMSG